jgi:hypothetical protein
LSGIHSQTPLPQIDAAVTQQDTMAAYCKSVFESFLREDARIEQKFIEQKFKADLERIAPSPEAAKDGIAQGEEGSNQIHRERQRARQRVALALVADRNESTNWIRLPAAEKEGAADYAACLAYKDADFLTCKRTQRCSRTSSA